MVYELYPNKAAPKKKKEYSVISIIKWQEQVTLIYAIKSQDNSDSGKEEASDWKGTWEFLTYG